MFGRTELRSRLPAAAVRQPEESCTTPFESVAPTEEPDAPYSPSGLRPRVQPPSPIVLSGGGDHPGGRIGGRCPKREA